MILATAALCLAANIYFEARGEIIPGQYAVALVTMNRAKQDNKKVCREVLKPKQFSWTNSRVTRDAQGHPILKGGMASIKEKGAWRRSLIIARVVLAKRMADITLGSKFYHTHEVKPKWRLAMVKTKVIGSHRFYRYG